jgi:heme exporter protein A
MALLEWDRLACRRGQRLLFRDLSATFSGGEIIRIAGPNGVGKSTLLRAVAGLAPLEAGTIRFQGRAITDADDAWRAALLYLGHSLAAHELLTPRENLRFLVTLLGQRPALAAIDAALAEVGLAAQRRLPLRLLSAGQRRRVGLARLFFASERPVWLLDEPLTALDQSFVGILTARIEAHARKGGVVLLTTHQEAPFATPPRTLDLTLFRPQQERAA